MHPPPLARKGNTKAPKFDGNYTYCCSDKGHIILQRALHIIILSIHIYVRKTKGVGVIDGINRLSPVLAFSPLLGVPERGICYTFLKSS